MPDRREQISEAIGGSLLDSNVWRSEEVINDAERWNAAVEAAADAVLTALGEERAGEERLEHRRAGSDDSVVDKPKAASSPAGSPVGGGSPEGLYELKNAINVARAGVEERLEAYERGVAERDMVAMEIVRFVLDVVPVVPPAEGEQG
jgi:hypothetical protein